MNNKTNPTSALDDLITYCPLTLDMTGNFFIRAAPESMPRPALRARTVLALASKANRLSVMEVSDFPIMDDAGFHYQDVSIYHDSEDRLLIEFYIKKMNEWATLCEQSDDKETAPFTNSPWVEKNKDTLPSYIPFVSDQNLAEGPADGQTLGEAEVHAISEGLKVKALLAHTAYLDAGWAHSQGWMIVFNQEEKDRVRFAETVMPSFDYLERQAKEEESAASEKEYIQHIEDRRRKERNKTNLIIQTT